MNVENIKELLKKYDLGQCSPEEADLVKMWYKDITEHEDVNPEELHFDQAKEEVWARLVPARITPIRYKFIAAAVLVLVVGAGLFYYYSSSFSKSDYAPGKNYAILTLTDGKKIVLDDQQTGRISDHYGVQVQKTGSGEITYKVDTTYQASADPVINTISTPRGGQFKVVLPDGSKVFLNAGSSLTFPERFIHERRVKLEGEAYFEVAKDTHKPFFVFNSNQLIRVTGTHFNVSSYFSHSTTVTLLEGAVLVYPGQKKDGYLLHPGEQSISTPTGLEIKKVNVDDFVGWTEGVFIWHGSPIGEVLQQLSYWYNVDFEFEQLPDELIYGQFPRNVPLSKVIQYIQKNSQIKFTTSGRRIMIR